MVQEAKNSSHNLFAPFLREFMGQRSPATVAAYARDLADFASWYLEAAGELPEPGLVTELDLAEYRQHLLSRAKPATVNRRLAALAAWLEWAFEKGLAARRPKMPRYVRRERLAPRALSRREQNAMLRAVERHGSARDRAVVYVLLFCGLRVGELVALRVEDVELKDRHGKIRVAGKGAKFREVLVPAAARKALKDYLGQEERAGFPRAEGAAHGPRRAADAQEARVSCPDRGPKPHVLRHTCATNLLNSGVDLVKVAAILGHENLNTTMVYTRPTFEDLLRAVDPEGREP